jgi:hypothetical protein
VTVKVLYLIGSGRSSSTLINNILGEVPGVFGAGEVGSLWRFGYLEGRTCACGAHVSECEIWGPVIKRVGASAGSGLTPDDIVGIQDRYLRERHIRGLLTSAIGIPRRMPPDLQLHQVSDRGNCGSGRGFQSKVAGGRFESARTSRTHRSQRRYRSPLSAHRSRS